MFGRRQVTFYGIFILKMPVIVANIFAIFFTADAVPWPINSLKTAVWAQLTCLIDGEAESRSH